MRKYKHIFFDLDNTLWDFDANSKKALYEAFKDFDLNHSNINFEEFYQKYKEINSELWCLYREKRIIKSDLIKARFQKSLEYFKVDKIDPVSFNTHYLNHMSIQTTLIPGTHDILAFLRGKGYQLHIITNGFREVQSLKISNSGLKEYFSRVFISEDLKAPKPDKKIFQHALRSCNAKKSESLMVGDIWDVDILGARNFGIDQVFFKPDRSAHVQDNINLDQGHLNANRTFVIRKLFDLKKILTN